MHEAIEAGVVVAVAPTALEKEINEHVADIANYANASEDRVREEWSEFRRCVHFYKPELTNQQAIVLMLMIFRTSRPVLN